MTSTIPEVLQRPLETADVSVVSYETHWRVVAKLIGYARVSTRHQVTDRQEADIVAAGVRRDDLYVDQGISGARASRPEFDKATSALEPGDTLVITTLDRLGRSTQNMLDLAQALRERGAGLRVLNLGGSDGDTATPMGSMLFTIMATLARMELDIKRRRIVDSISKRRDAGKDLGGRPQSITDSQIRSAIRLVESGEPAAQVARDIRMSRATFYRKVSSSDLVTEQVAQVDTFEGFVSKVRGRASRAICGYRNHYRLGGLDGRHAVDIGSVLIGALAVIAGVLLNELGSTLRANRAERAMKDARVESRRTELWQISLPAAGRAQEVFAWATRASENTRPDPYEHEPGWDDGLFAES